MCSLYCVGRWGWGHGKLGCYQFHVCFFNDRENPSDFPAASSCVLVGSEHVCGGSRDCLRGHGPYSTAALIETLAGGFHPLSRPA